MTNDPLGEDGGKALPSSPFLFDASTVLAKATDVARAIRANAELAADPVFAETLRLFASDPDVKNFANRLKHELAHLTAARRAQFKAGDLDDDDNDEIRGFIASLEFRAMRVSLLVSAVVYRRPWQHWGSMVTMADIEAEPLDSDHAHTWSEYIRQTVGYLIEARTFLRIEPGALLVCELKKEYVVDPCPPARAQGDRPAQPRPVRQDPQPTRKQQNARRRGRLLLAGKIVDPEQHLAEVIATARAWLAERGAHKDERIGPHYSIAFYAATLERLARGSRSTKNDAARMLRYLVLHLRDEVPSFVRDGYRWTSKDDERLESLVSQTLLALGDRVQFHDGTIVDPLNHACDEARPRASI